MDQKQDVHYQRKMDHENRSKVKDTLMMRFEVAMKELKIRAKALQEEKWRPRKARTEEEVRGTLMRFEAAREEMRRKAKACKEETLRQQKARAEEEVRREAARKAEKETKAADKERENSAKQVGTMASSAMSNVLSTTGNFEAADDALELEQIRRAKYSELEQRNQLILPSSDKDLHPMECEIARIIEQIGGSMESVREKANDLVKIFSDPAYHPQSVTVAMFAKKVVSICETPNSTFNNSAYALGHVIVYVSSQVPEVMDCILAELHKACCYVPPKHLVFSKPSDLASEDNFKEATGFPEEEGKIETMDLERLASYMKLYGAIVQTEAQGVQNLHGIEEGWTWLTSFLRTRPANIFTCVALEAFLRMAGFGLHRKYKAQFVMILMGLKRKFIPSLRASQNENIGTVITRLQEYMETKEFLKEPDGWALKSSLLSSDMAQSHESLHDWEIVTDRDILIDV